MLLGMSSAHILVRRVLVILHRGWMVIAILLVSQRTAIGTAAIAATVLKRVRRATVVRALMAAGGTTDNATLAASPLSATGMAMIAPIVLKLAVQMFARTLMTQSLNITTVVATLIASPRTVIGMAMTAEIVLRLVLPTCAAITAIILNTTTVLATSIASTRSEIGMAMIAEIVLRRVRRVLAVFMIMATVTATVGATTKSAIGMAAFVQHLFRPPWGGYPRITRLLLVLARRVVSSRTLQSARRPQRLSA
jgi:hypothetical protein